MLLTFVFWALASWPIVTVGYIAWSYWRKLRREGKVFTWWINYPMYLATVIFVLADVVFNATWGSWVFREAPREWLFTARVKRHYRAGADRDSKRWHIADEWRVRLNTFDEGHVT